MFRTSGIGTLGVLLLSGLPVFGAIRTVTDNSDSGLLGSLRGELQSASAGDTIVFAPNVTGAITLNSGPLGLSKNNLTVAGPGADVLAIDGNNSSRIFVVVPGVSAVISGLTLQHGRELNPGGGGAIFNQGNLALDKIYFHE